MTKKQLLTDVFINQYPDSPAHMSELGKFVYYRTYSRYLPKEQRRETWRETVRRATEYNVGLAVKHLRKLGYTIDYKVLQREAEGFFDSMFNLKQFLSGRTLWVGGTENGVAEKYPLANFNCFTRDTEFITDKGIKSFNDFADGDTANVLTSTGGFKPATVTSFGADEVVELVVQKGKHVETIKTTAGHRWFVDKHGKYTVKTTSELATGDNLRMKRCYEHNDVNVCNVGIMHGVVFGDGTYDKRKNHCSVSLIGDKVELLEHFTTGGRSTRGDAGGVMVYGLPHTWKELPSIESNVEYLAGFLVGLFATDGSITNNQHTISSSKREVIEFVRNASTLLGIYTGAVRGGLKPNPFKEGEERELYELSLSPSTLFNGFHLLRKHKDSYVNTGKTVGYKVKEIIYTGEHENVWCVHEPVTESFTLANGILTRNCSFVNIKSYDDLGDLFYLLLVGKPLPTLNHVNRANGCVA